MTSSKVISLIVLLYWIIFYYVLAVIASIAEPYFDTVSLPPETPSPLNINSSDSQLIFTIPLLTYVTKDVNDTMQNIGNQVFITPASNSGTFMFGGVLGFVKYVIHGMLLFWNFSMGPSAAQVNGVGTPVELIFYFRNSNYDTFEDAINFRDGITIVSNRILVIDDCKENAYFDEFIPYLKSILSDGATISVPEGIIWDWVSKPLRAGYLAYAGAYIDPSTLKQYSCATVIVNTLINAPRISLAQFQSSFRLFAGDNPYPIAMSTGTPVVLAGPAFVVQSGRSPS